MKFGTKAIHAGVRPDPTTGAIMTPIYQTSTYAQTHPGGHKGYEYSRCQNPTRQALEDNLAALENGKFGYAFASGIAAIDAVLKLLNPGDEVISTAELYGGAYRLFTTVFAKYGIKFTFVGMESPKNIEKHITESTKLIWIETPTNPLVNIIDIEGVAAVSKKHNCLLGVDNTFASPYLQNPLDLGADIVMHSVTKYIGGHSDVLMGALICKDQELADKLYFVQYSSGAVPGPQDCFLALRGIKTLHLRMQRHCENGREVALFLKENPKVEKIYWPGLSSHPNHDVAKNQMRDFGGMLSFTLKGDNYNDAVKFLSGTRIVTLAESLGGVESLSNHPASMTHASVPKEEREKIGISESLIRLSIGVEDIEDILADIKQSIDKI
jgi:cystathionine gamma-lyase